MTSQIKTHKEYLIQSYNILLVIVLHSKVMTYGQPVRVYDVRVCVCVCVCVCTCVGVL